VGIDSLDEASIMSGHKDTWVGKTRQHKLPLPMVFRELEAWLDRPTEFAFLLFQTPETTQNVVYHLLGLLNNLMPRDLGTSDNAVVVSDS
jgi:hypothetical protein